MSQSEQVVESVKAGDIFMRLSPDFGDIVLVFIRGVADGYAQNASIRISSGGVITYHSLESLMNLQNFQPRLYRKIGSNGKFDSSDFPFTCPGVPPLKPWPEVNWAERRGIACGITEMLFEKK